MSEHTTAPWTYVESGNYSGAFDIYGNEIEVEFGEFGSILAQCDYLVAQGIEREADARLIAAAPDLLKQLELVYGYWQTMRRSLGDPQAFLPSVDAALAKSRDGDARHE